MPAYNIGAGADFEDGVLVVETGAAKHHGIALWPVPSDNPEDPLRWPRWLKIVAFVVAGLCNFSGNISGSGISVASQQLMMNFGKTENQVNSGIMAYNFLLLGIGNLFWVPVAVKFGKRLALISSTCILFGSLIWCAKAQTFGSLVGGRCIAGFAASAGESIVPAIVPDIFFLHERGAMMSMYVILTAGGSAVGPLIAGYMIEGTGSWRDFVWFTAALAGFNLLCLLFAFPESTFERPTTLQNIHENMESKTDALHVEAQEKAADIKGLSTAMHGAQTINVSSPSYTKMITTVLKLNPEVNFFKTLLHPFIFLTYIPVVWAIFVYGVSLSPQIILIFKFPSLLTPPPYLFSTGEIGLMEVAALIGFVFACFSGGWASDIITARRIVKSGGTVYAEQRLLSLIPGMAIAPAGCILIAFAGSKKLPWPALAIGFGMLSFGTVYSPNIAITYVVDSYPRYAAESLVLINIVKNIVAFIFIYVAVEWIESEGFLQVYMIMFMLACVALLLAVPLYFYGRQWRLAVSKSQRHKWFL